jgi:quinol monooxygenase YgiN
MSGRRRRDDGWDDSRLDSQDDRRDPWADDSIGEWGGPDTDGVEEADRPRQSSGGAAGAYVRNAPASGKAYAAPEFPSFQAGGSSSSGDRYGASSGQSANSAYGGQRGSSNGYASGGYNADGYRDRDASYGGGRDGYQSAGYGRTSGSANGAGRRDAAGYDSSGYGAGYGGADGRSGTSGYAPGFTPADNDESDDDGSAGTPRPYGRLSIYTLHDDKTREFDRIAERAAEGVRTLEPDTLVYVIHVVPKAPQQRIIYEIYRDRAAFMSHERQPHIRQFAAERASCVLATNIIDLRLKYAKVAALGSPSEAAAQGAAAQPQAQPQASWSPRAEPAQGGKDRYAAAAQYSPTQYTPAPQHSSAQPQGPAAAATFTPAPDSNQYPTVGRDAYPPAPQYGNSGNNGTYGASNGQYDAANSNGYSGAAGYANGGSYSSSGYPSPNASQGGNGYSRDNGYSGASGDQSGNGYSGANGYANGSGYQGAGGYANGGNGYRSGGYSNGANGYGAAAGYSENNGASSYSASARTQYTPRYRELTSGSQPEADTNGYQDGSRSQSSEWDPRSQGYQ